MKTLLIVILMLIGSAAIAQLESPSKPDKPSGYTEHYGFRLYDSGNYPGADSLNQNVIDIDKEIHDSRLLTMLCLFMTIIPWLCYLAILKAKKQE